MGKPSGFLEIPRVDIIKRDPRERVHDYRETDRTQPPEIVREQAARCMDCGIPYCQADTGCPLGNLIPDWNHLTYTGEWQEALHRLHATNNFPEVTGRVCPAPCEQACTLNINVEPVTIKQIERTIADQAISNGWIRPERARRRTGKKVAVIGSGPSGLAAAQQLARAGHAVTVYEKQDRIGGLMRYGIPDFKLEKHILDRRVEQMKAEGVKFRVRQHVGVDIDAAELIAAQDAVVLACGAEKPRDLPIPGRELQNIHFAMDFLRQSNKRVAGDRIPKAQEIYAAGRRVVVIGGGDTGADCIGTCHRQGAVSVHNLELLPQPPRTRHPMKPWPWWPYKLITSYAHEEGGEREFAVATKAFLGDAQGRVRSIAAVRLEWSEPDATGRREMREIPGSEFEIPCDMVLLALGFVHTIHEGLVQALGLKLDGRGNVATNERWQTSVDKVFCAGDMARGQSLVVWAIADGRRAARAVDEYLMGWSELPRGPRRDMADTLGGRS